MSDLIERSAVLDLMRTNWADNDGDTAMQLSIDDVRNLPAASADEMPAVDAIKREAVLNTLDTMDKALDENRTVEAYKELLAECYKELLPVTPKPTECEDAVSREAVKSALCELCGDKNSCPFVNGDCDDLNAINALPPVTPERTRGKWIHSFYSEGEREIYKCSECGRWLEFNKHKDM